MVRQRPRSTHEITLFPEGAFGAQQLDRRPVARVRLVPDDTVSRDPLFAQVLQLYYRVSVGLLDHCFGRLVDTIRAAGLIEDSLIAFTSDHGETLYRDSALFKWTHGGEVAPEAIQVPLLLRLPGPHPRAGAYEGVSCA